MEIYRLKGTAGPVINRSFPLGERLLIGSQSDCDVRLEEQGVAGHHAEVVLKGKSTVMVRSLDSNA